MSQWPVTWYWQAGYYHISLSLLLRCNIFRLFPLLLPRTGNPVLLPYYQKSAPALWERKASFHTLPGHFISGVTSPEYRWIARLYYRCRNFITNRHTSSLQSAYLRLSHHRWRKREKKSAVWQWLMRRQAKKARVFRGQIVLSNDAQ